MLLHGEMRMLPEDVIESADRPLLFRMRSHMPVAESVV